MKANAVTAEPLGTMTPTQRAAVRALIHRAWIEELGSISRDVIPPTDQHARLVCLLLCRKARLGTLSHHESLLLADLGIALVESY